MIYIFIDLEQVHQCCLPWWICFCMRYKGVRLHLPMDLFLHALWRSAATFAHSVSWARRFRFRWLWKPSKPTSNRYVLNFCLIVCASIFTLLWIFCNISFSFLRSILSPNKQIRTKFIHGMTSMYVSVIVICPWRFCCIYSFTCPPGNVDNESKAGSAGNFRKINTCFA